MLMPMLSELLFRLGHIVLWIAFFTAPWLVLETLWSRGELPSVVYRLRVLFFQVCFAMAAWALGLAIHNITPLRFAPVFALPGLWCVLVGILATDFLYYWMHRVQHAVPILWRFHKVHHSAEQMGAGQGYHHASQFVIEAFVLVLPVSLFMPLNYLGLMNVIVTLQGYYIHSATRLHVPGGLIVDNHIHRVHHSRDKAHFNTNFGVYTTLWDRLFGTMRLPEKDDWPSVGLDDFAEPNSPLALLTIPHPQSSWPIQSVEVAPSRPLP